MNLLQLDPPLPLITPKGPAQAHVLIDYGQEADLCWTVFQDDTGECWTWRNQEVRMAPNRTFARGTKVTKRPLDSL